jgi:hypothetical protein
MLVSLLFILSITFTAKAQFEDFENILAPTTLTPKIGIICKTDVMFGTTDLVIDVKNGHATQIVGDKKYIYQVDSFVCEKIQGDKNVLKLDLKGSLSSVIDASTGLELKPVIKSSSFVFSSYLPTKDGKKFKANSFNLASDVKFKSGSSFNINNQTTHSTNCTLVKGGKFVKNLASSNKVKFAGGYNKPEVDDSNRNQGKDIDQENGAPLTPGHSNSSKQ